MKGKICLIYNFPQHYREAIFKKIDIELNCDFYFGDKLDWAPDIKSMPINNLNGFKKTLKNIRLFKLYTWQIGAFELVFKNYDHYILYGDPFCISNYFIVIVAKILGKKTYLWTHGLYQEISWKAKVINFPFYYLSTKVLLYGNFSRNRMIKFGFKKEKLLCIYNSLSYFNQFEIRKKLTSSQIYKDYFNNSFPVIIYIGRIQKVKKINQLVEAIYLLKQEGVFVNLVIVGEDNERVDILKNIREFNLNDTTWLYGSCYDEEKIGELIYNAEVCVSPGNIGLTAIHSMSYGTPAITHDNFQNQMPEFEAINEEKTGCFFKENDVKDLSLKLKCWINLDNFKRNEIRKNCYKVIDELYNPNFQINLLKSID